MTWFMYSPALPFIPKNITTKIKLAKHKIAKNEYIIGKRAHVTLKPSTKRNSFAGHSSHSKIEREILSKT